MRHFVMISSCFFFLTASVVAGLIRVPQDQPTIQAGINTAQNGDTVLVADSTYYENINFMGKAITVASYFLIDKDSTHLDSTIIDGSQPTNPDSGSVVIFVSGEDTTSVLCGFTITNGTGTKISTPFEYRGGGGIFCFNSGCSIVANKIHNNSVDYTTETLGGGICVDAPSSMNVIIEGNEIESNTVTGIWGAYGGGMEVINCNAKVINNIVNNNICDGTAGQANSGGIGFWSDSPDTPFVAIKENQISHNTAKGIDAGSNSGAGSGGLGIYRYYAAIEKNEITHNIINGSQDAYGAGLSCGDIRDNLLIDGNYIAHNFIEHGTGWGGGLCIYRASATVINNIIVNNSAADGSDSYGGGIWIRDSSTVNISNNTILFNVANEGGGINSRNSNTTIMNTILWGDSSTTGHHELQSSGITGSLNVVYSDVEGGWNGDGNMDEDPLIVADSLSDSSPCISKGTLSYNFAGEIVNAPSNDFNGRMRPYPTGSNPDMGAWESKLAIPLGIEQNFFSEIPNSYLLYQNYPNPFNPTTTIMFYLPKTSEVTLKVFNILGEEVVTLVSDWLYAGSYSYDWYASNLASGVYLYILQAGDYVETRKMILMR